jgi:photosystem II stability/assembly factor-like uncharacterized protein
MVVQLPPDKHVADSPADVDAGVIDDAKAGVIDDARARHLRERWASAIVAAIAVGIGLLFGLSGAGGGAGAGRHPRGSGPSPSAGHSSSRPVAVIGGRAVSATQFGLLAPAVGWAVLENGFYVTRDGGGRWLGLSVDYQHGNHYGNVSVPGLGLTGDVGANITATAAPSANVLAIGFIDGRAASACKPPRYPATGAGAIALTDNAGRTWSTHILPGCNTASSLSFINARVGFAVLGDAQRSSNLYRTDDGGRRWQLVSRFPAPMAVSFGNEHDGLAFVTPNTKSAAAVLYRTTNGGRNWQRSRICGDMPDPTFTVYCDLPTSFGNRGVVLAVAQNLSKAHSDHAFLYATSDAGRHWTRHLVPPLDSPEMPAFSAPNPNDLFVYSINGVLHTSTDGGRTWSSISEPQFRTMSEMQFINADYGWMTSPHGFDYTTDGGRSWKPIGTR